MVVAPGIFTVGVTIVVSHEPASECVIYGKDLW